MTELPIWAQSLGGGVLFSLVVWLIWRDWRRERTAEQQAQTGMDAQTDAHSIQFMQVVLGEQGKLRERVALLEDRERRHADVLQRHASWDARAVAMLQAHDPTTLTALGDPPPLYPNGG